MYLFLYLYFCLCDIVSISDIGGLGGFRQGGAWRGAKRGHGSLYHTIPYHRAHWERRPSAFCCIYEMDQMCLTCVEWTILRYMCGMDHLKIYHIICKAKDWVLPVINLWPARPSYLSETIQTQYKPALSFIISHVLQVAITHIKIQMDRCTSCRSCFPQELINHKAPSTEPRQN